jgi:hypothetical protein
MNANDELYNHPEIKAYLAHAEKEMLPKMKESAMSVAIVTDAIDPKICMEIGAAVLYDKPLVIVLRPGTKVTANLKRLASTIIEGDMNDPSTHERLQDAITKVLTQDRRVKKDQPQ